jgi:hypothetical protein
MGHRTVRWCTGQVLFTVRCAICACSDFCARSPESSLVGFGGLDDNPIKGLTSVLSVEQVLNEKQTGFNTSDLV